MFKDRGLPTIAEVGDDASYDFIVLLSGDDLLARLSSAALPQIKAAGTQGSIPTDATTYYETRLRVKEAQDAARKDPPSNPALRDQIEHMVKADQEVRQQKGFDAARMTAIDAQNAPILQGILDKYGVPSYASVGPEASGDFVLMIQH
ncbi:MAG: hypothetical protein ACRD3B_01495, partial [Candidatus Sulfotelmatobacter sp.]